MRACLTWLLGACLLAGCYSTREGLYEPPPPSSIPGEPAARAIGLASLQLASDLVLQLPDWAEGRFPGGEGAPPPVWDDSEKSWVFSESQAYGVYPSVIQHDYVYKVQYLRGRDWQQSYEGADSMWVRVYLDQEGHVVTTEGGYHYTLDYHYRYTVQGKVTGIPAFPLRFNGTGSMEGDDRLVSERGVSEVTYAASYDADIFGTEEGCPQGSMVTTIDPYNVTGVFNGTSIASWTLKLGAVTRSSGTLVVSCYSRRSKPAAPMPPPTHMVTIP